MYRQRGFSWRLCASPSAYPASMEADLKPAGDGQPRRGAWFWPPVWSFADCGVFTVAVTGKGCHDLSNDIQLASRHSRRRAIAAAQRRLCRRPRATRSAGVSEHHSSHSNASRLLCASLRRRAFLMTELQWHFSVPLDQRARRQFQRWIVGRVGKGSRSSGCLVMVVLLLFAPRSLGGFRSRLPLRLLLRSRLRVVP